MSKGRDRNIWGTVFPLLPLNYAPALHHLPLPSLRLMDMSLMVRSSNHFKAERHKQRLDGIGVDLRTVSVRLTSQQSVEMMVVDDDTAATARVMTAVTVQLQCHGLLKRQASTTSTWCKNSTVGQNRDTVS